ncbi:MAG: KTSC domain-containing protein [Chitinophagaceae bacterium]|nr:KTSC domain-containing protein [Chitinophagaceae bacterium]
MKRKRLSRKNAIHTPESRTTVMINYSDVSHTLEVEYSGNRVYHYYDVDPQLWQEYKAVIESKGSSGRFVNARVKPFHEDEEII